MNKTAKRALPIVALVLVGGGVWLRLTKFESAKPSVRLEQENAIVGRELGLKVGDSKSGVAEVKVEAVQGGKSFALYEEKFPRGTSLVEKTLPMRPLPQGLNEGEVQIRITAKDHSWNGGNMTVLEKKMIVDTQPPQVSLIGGPHYIRQGGSGLITFKTNEEAPATGIQVGDHFFQGYPAGANRYLAYYALPYGEPKEISIGGVAEDAAGNRGSFRFRPVVKPKAFKKDTIKVGREFLDGIIPYFKERDASLKGTDLEIFLSVNRTQRESDYQQILKICRDTAPRPLWSGPFLRLPNSKPMASFGEERTYLYEGREIDRQIHLGIDLASLAQSPIPAANSGRVVFAGPLGIYGNTVILDHGCGLFSMYCHLSLIQVEVKKEVAKGDSLGRSGSTGLAGGDHLHYAMLVQGIFVDPIEWWDAHWIKDNIELKMK